MIVTNDEIHHELVESLGEFLSDYYRDEIATAVQEGAGSITVDFADLYQYDHDIAADYVDSPDVLVDHLDRATYEVDIPVPGSDNVLADMVVRVGGVDTEQTTVNKLRESHRGKYLGLRGQVSRASQVRPRTVKAVFRCERCTTPDTDFLLDPIPQYGEEIQLPGDCPGCGRQGPYTLIEEKSTMVDHQKIQLADEPGENMGANTHTVPVHLYRDLSGGVMPGDRVQINGKVTTERADGTNGKKLKTSRPWRVEAREVDPEEVAFSEVTPERLEEIEALSQETDLVQRIIDSIAPHIVSDDRGDMHKLAISLQMFGGVKHDNRRGDINVFLVGSKGTGKSQLLSRAAELAPKSVEASGKGATAAGLTATATQSEHGGWMLDAGALVLASGGMASIDEFDKMSSGARKSMHEAMEDQRVPINKAGINTVLPTETAILAAANPATGEFDRTQNLTAQIDLQAPLISRFDLIFGLIDNQDREWDETVAKAQYDTSGDEQPIDDELLTEYIAYARQNVSPEFANEAVKDRLVSWYVDKREEYADTDGLNIGPRTNDALRRLAEASARMRLSETVEMEDAERAIELKKMHFGDVMLNQDGEIDAAKGMGYDDKSQQKRRQEIVDAVEGTPQAPSEVAEEIREDFETVRNDLQKLQQNGDVDKLPGGRYEA